MHYSNKNRNISIVAWKQVDKQNSTLFAAAIVASFSVFCTSDVENNKLLMISMAGFSTPEYKCQALVQSLVLQIPMSLDLQLLAKNTSNSLTHFSFP